MKYSDEHRRDILKVMTASQMTQSISDKIGYMNDFKDKNTPLELKINIVKLYSNSILEHLDVLENKISDIQLSRENGI